MKALLHVHSSYSYDGVRSLAELARWGAARDLDFLFLSEHTNDFDQGKMERFVEECDALSGSGARLVPGLEFPVEGGFHILGYNLREYAPLTDPAQAVRFIRDRGGLAVLAHPARYRGRWPASSALAMMNGVEAWNARYDGRFVPSGVILASCRARMREAGGPRTLFGGQDLHDISAARLVTTHTNDPGGLEEAISALARGDSRFGSNPIFVTGSGDVSAAALGGFRMLHAVYSGFRGFRDRLQARSQEPTVRL